MQVIDLHLTVTEFESVRIELFNIIVFYFAGYIHYTVQHLQSIA